MPSTPCRLAVAFSFALTTSPPENLRRIFEPFYTTKGIGGTGLGLWLSHDIIMRHRGVLRVRSSKASSHSGTVFTLYLPIDASPNT